MIHQMKKIPLMELFGPTIQGEGDMAGTQTMFIRFGLCDSACTMCDSKRSVEPASVKKFGERLTQEEIFVRFTEYVNKNDCAYTKWVSLSGGNPCIHDLGWLVRRLQQDGFLIAVETQGTKCPSWLQMCDAITVSPKGPGMGETFDEDKFLNMLGYFEDWRLTNYCMKIVVFDEPDLVFAERILDIVKQNPRFDIGRSFYLSLGNPVLPSHTEEDTSTSSKNALVEQLLNRYNTIYEKLQRHPKLRDARFLPQLHVLVWGNKQEV